MGMRVVSIRGRFSIPPASNTSRSPLGSACRAARRAALRVRSPATWASLRLRASSSDTSHRRRLHSRTRNPCRCCSQHPHRRLLAVPTYAPASLFREAGLLVHVLLMRALHALLARYLAGVRSGRTNSRNACHHRVQVSYRPLFQLRSKAAHRAQIDVHVHIRLRHHRRCRCCQKPIPGGEGTSVPKQAEKVAHHNSGKSSLRPAQNRAHNNSCDTTCCRMAFFLFLKHHIQ